MNLPLAIYVVPDSLYVLDDDGNAFFPQDDGRFETARMNPFAIYKVDGDPIGIQAHPQACRPNTRWVLMAVIEWNLI